MSPDDPRHGTPAGTYAHNRADIPLCEPCRRARNEDRRQRYNDIILRRPRSYPPKGFRRRVEALQALGWSLNHIATELGTTPQIIRHGAFRATYITTARYKALLALYERLSMTVPDDPRANRRRMIAARKGYAPPLAWDDIDTDPAPHGLTETPRDLLAEYDFLTRCGESHEQAIRQLGVTAGAIERAAARRTQRAEREAA